MAFMPSSPLGEGPLGVSWVGTICPVAGAGQRWAWAFPLSHNEVADNLGQGERKRWERIKGLVPAHGPWLAPHYTLRLLQPAAQVGVPAVGQLLSHSQAPRREGEPRAEGGVYGQAGPASGTRLPPPGYQHSPPAEGAAPNGGRWEGSERVAWEWRGKAPSRSRPCSTAAHSGEDNPLPATCTGARAAESLGSPAPLPPHQATWLPAPLPVYAEQTRDRAGEVTPGGPSLGKGMRGWMTSCDEHFAHGQTAIRGAVHLTVTQRLWPLGLSETESGTESAG